MDILIFDLDNTLYPAEKQLFNLIDVRINRYMTEIVGIPAPEVDPALRPRHRRHLPALARPSSSRRPKEPAATQSSLHQRLNLPRRSGALSAGH
jgi:FMN phosphatase YigB (HAD superfamily)